MEVYNNIGDNADGTLAEFCEYLSKEASDLKEDQKVNLAYKWITENIKYDTEGVKAGTEERDPDKFFKSRKTVCSGYAHLMYKLLVSMNYDKDNIKNITGYAKGEGYSVYEVPKVSHEWNAIKIDGKWCLIDATWDAGNTHLSVPDISDYWGGLPELVPEIQSVRGRSYNKNHFAW